MGRASKDKRDMYYRKAKEEGYRARSAYKLLQLHEEFHILRRDAIQTGVVDLCAAPGSWSQVLSQHLRPPAEMAVCEEAEMPITPLSTKRCDTPPRIVAVDLQEMMPIDGVCLLQGDITSEATAREIITRLNDDVTHATNGASSLSMPNAHNAVSHSGNSKGAASLRKADLVVCDGAPDVTGMHELDEYLQHHLLLAALNITTFVLRQGGTFVTKMFRGPNTPFLVAKSEVFFRHVIIAKPKSSRNASMEAFMVCQDYQPPIGYQPSFDRPLTVSNGRNASSNVTSNEESEKSHVERIVVPFLACGDLSGYDADMCYDRDGTAAVLPPVHPPIETPYMPKCDALNGSGKGEMEEMTIQAKRRRVE